MSQRLSRRELLERMGVAASALISAKTARAQDAVIRIADRPIEIVITPVSALTTRISFLSLETGRPQAIRGDGSLVEDTWPSPAARIRTLAAERRVQSGDLIVRLSTARSPDTFAVQIDVSSRDGRAIQRLRIYPERGAVGFSLGDGLLLGLGEGGPQFDRRGSIDRMRSGQGGYQLRTHGGRVPVQWIVGTGGWAMFIHQPYGAFDFTGAEGRFDPFGATPLPIDLFVVGSREPAHLMAEYARLTGHPEMPPLWALGYQQSHRTLASPEEILEEAKTFREKKLPCETLIYLGTGFCPSGWNTDNGEFSFNPKVFQDPAAIIRRLHGDHFKVVLHVVLEGRTLTGTVADRCTAPPLPSGRTADGRWPDQGDGLDAPSRLARNRMYWDGSRVWRPDERPFALHRNGHAGMQRYAAFLWSGDVYSTWETLKTHVPVAINTGLSGIPFWGTDIGGFVPTKEFTGELYVRWFQFGAFCPLFRSHGRTWKLRLPWGWNTGTLEPDEIANYTGGAANPDPSELHNAAVEPICRQYLELRSRLMPYLYGAVREAHATGLPIVRALWLHYSNDPTATARSDQYLWGRDILVAPVVEKGATVRGAYLPAGLWYDFWTEEIHHGGREIARTVDLATLPLFVRAGAILPLGPVKQYTSEPVGEPLTLQIYPGADGASALYEDDGISFGHRRGDWMGIDVGWVDRDRRVDLRLAPGSRMRPPAPRHMRVRVAGSPATRDIVFTGAPLRVRL